MKTSRTFVAVLALASLALAGCDTPDARIKDSPQAFARLTPTEQELVKKGQIAVGFDMDAVRLALGDPTRITQTTDRNGQREVWHYVTYEDADGIIIYTGYYHRWAGWGGPRFWGNMGYYDGRPVHVHDRIRVEFDVQNRVSVIEEDKP
jgi:outer membrane protein assembly factor BamE (lipoprotein component of BamABCDE complex)